MKGLVVNRTPRVIVGLLLAGLAGSALAAPGAAQTSGRFRVLVPALEGKGGSKVADLVRKSIDQMTTHVAIPEKEVKAALKKLGTKESEMDCLKYRQLMSHVDAKLVMCGVVDGSGQVVAQFYNPDGTSYDVPPFAYTGETAAAQQITQAFGAYNELVRVLAFCDDYLGSQQWQDALNQCGKAAELNPKSARALYAKGAAQRALEQHDEALATFQKVLELDPINQDAMLSAAIEASTLGQDEVSRKYLDSYLELNPGDANVRLSIASRVAKEGDFRSALAIIEASEQNDTANVSLREYAGHFAIGAAGKLVNAARGGEVPESAKELFRKAISHYSFLAAARPDSVGGVVLRNLMIAHAAVGNTAEAISWGQKAVAQPDVDAQTWSIYADQLRSAQRYQEALAALEKVAQLDPSSTVVGRRALILVDMNRLADAGDAIKQARARNELSDEQVDGIAQRLIKTGYEDFQKAKKYEQAFRYYENARQIATSSKTRAMANYLQGYGMYEQARAIQEKSTVQSARQSLPIFQRAKSLLQNSTAYSDGGAAEGRASLLKAIDQLIEIQNTLINRG